MAEVQLATLAAETREAIDSEDFARAAAACRRALARYPRWVEGYWLLGHILVESGYVAQARSCFEAVASAIPDDPRAYEGLAAAAEQEQDVATAVAGLMRAVEVGESSPNVQEELKRLQRQAGYIANDGFTNARVAHARLIAGQYEEADIAAERGLADEPDRLDLLTVQAVARLFGGDRKGSQRVCQRLLDLSPDCLKALAIMRYLSPGDQTAGLMADLDALDPESQTLVWLHSQMTMLGYEADDLPSVPRLVRWRGDGDQDGQGVSRQLDQLIPELEEVWPQWLQEAAQLTPATTPAEEALPSAGAPAPVETETPSFLGDVNALAREFEEAMRTSTAPVVQTAEPSLTPWIAQAPTDAAAAAPVEPDAAPSLAEPLRAESAFGMWQATPEGAAASPGAHGAGLAEAGVVPESATPTWAAWEETAVVAVEPAEPVAESTPAAVEAPEARVEPEPAVGPAPGGFGDWVLTLAPMSEHGAFVDLRTGGEQSAASPPWEPAIEATPVDAPPPAERLLPAQQEAPDPSAVTAAAADDVDGLRQAAQAAARVGDYWTAIAWYGEALERLHVKSAGDR